MAALYRVGERVDGLYDENTDDMWYPGRIRCVHRGEEGTGCAFEVVYDDGEVEMNVRPEFLRQHVPGTICVGSRVLCRYDGGEEYYPGQVSDVQENGKYTIAYDDGEVEEDVPLDHIVEPEDEENKEAGEDDERNEENELREATDDPPPEGAQQQEDEEAEMDQQEPPLNSEGNCDTKATESSENRETVDSENHSDEPVTNEPFANVQPPRAEQSQGDEPPANAIRNGDHPDPTPTGGSAERAYIVESLQLLEKRLGDSASTKSVLSTLVKQMRAYPQLTADLVHECGGERLIVDALKFHQSHAVIQCYGFVLLRRLCFLCVKSTHFLLRNGIVELVIQAMNAFAEDAILQASACGALAVFTRVQAGLNILIEYQIAQLVLSTLIYHKTYSVHTRQVHYYACEVLLELCELDDQQTLNLLCGEQEEDFTGDMSPISLLLFLLRQGLSLDDKKACCAVGSLLMCLAASGRRAAALVLSLNGLAELSTVMARYPTEPSIQKYSSAASKQIALSSVRQSPTKRIKDTAKEILREAESLENPSTERASTKRSVPRRSTSIGKRKSNPTAGYGAPAYPRGAAYTSSTSYRSAQGVSSISSPFAQPSPRFGGEANSFGYPGRDFGASATAPQPPSSLVILDGSLGVDNGLYGSTSKRKQLSKEDRQSELFDAYGIHEIPSSVNSGRPYGTKRAQLRAHLASAESAWATPQPYGHSASKPYSSRSEHLDHGPAYAQREFMSSRQNGWAYDSDEPQNSVYDPDLRQPRGAKRKKKNPGTRTAFQVKVENENQLRVSRETRSPYPSPQRLGVATKRAAKARQKRITAGGNSTLTGRSNNASSESLNDYATQLFQENASRAVGVPSSSKLTPREKEEIRERERLSFAEKLHKMIDKAKSTLANGNTVSVAFVDDARRPQKSGVTSKPARKARESQAAPVQDKRPQSKKTGSAVSALKHATKEVSSPRDAAETRPPKPASDTSKRQQDAGSQLTPSALKVSTSSRTKPNTSRPVLPPKISTDSKPRSAVKPSKTTTTKIASKREGEKSNVETVPTEVAQSSTPVVDEPHQAEQVAAEPALSATQLSEESAAAPSLAVAEQLEPELSTSGGSGKEEEVAVPSETTTASETEQSTVEPGAGQLTQLPGDVKIEVVAPSVEVEVEVVAPPVDDPLTKEEGCIPVPGVEAAVEAAAELPNPSVETQQPTEAPTEEPSAELQSVETHTAAASAITDAMYGDTFSEFDDNAGDDEDAATEAGPDAEDAHTIVTEATNPATDAPLQESKSGEALYDDGYDEFDEDEAPNTEDADTEDATAAEAVESQGAEVSYVIPQRAEDVPAPAASVPEVEANHLVAQTEDPSVAEEAVLASPTEEVEGDTESSLHMVDVDGTDKSVDVTPVENENPAELPEESHTPESDEVNTEDVTQSAPSDSDPGVSSAGFEEDDESKPTSEETSFMVKPTGESLSEETPSDQEIMRVDETTDDVTASEHVENITVREDGAEGEPKDSNLDAGLESAGENTESSVQPAADENEDPSANAPDEAGASLDLASEETAVQSINEDQAKETTDTDAHADETLAVSESVPSMEQDEESKTLSADNSNLSIQSAAYDEENFDDEESHQEEKPSEAEGIDASVAVAEDGVDVVNPEPSDENAGATDTPAETASEDPSALEQREEEPKTLVANSSEASVQSAVYEDEYFEDGAHDTAEQVSELEAESITTVGVDGHEAPVETNLGAPTEDSDPVSADFSDHGGQSSVEDAHEETQYADAEFEEAGNDAPGSQDVSPEHELVQSDGAAPSDSTVDDGIVSDEAAPAEENEAAVNGDSEVAAELGVVDIDEASARLAEVPMNDDTEISEVTANADSDGVEGHDQPRTNAAADADDLNDLMPENAEDASTSTRAELEDTPMSDLGGTDYTEDFPPAIAPEREEEVDEATASVGIDDVSNEDTVTVDENTAIKPGEDDETDAVAESTDVMPEAASKGIVYDEDGDDDKNSLAADPSATYNEVKSGPAVEEEPANDADISTFEEAAFVAESEQLHIDENVDAGLDIIAGPEAVDAETENSDTVNAVEVETTETTFDTEAEKFESEAVDLAVVEQEDHVSGAIESEPVLNQAVEHEGVKSELSEPEADKPEQVEAEVVSSEANVETEVTEAAASEVSETEATESNDVSADHPVEESASADPEEVVYEATEPEAAQPETLETDAVETPVVDPDAVEPETLETNAVETPVVDPEAVEPETLETNAVETHIVDPDAVEREQSETVEATTVDEASPTVEESSSTEPALEVPAELEAKEEDAVVESPELPTSAEPVVSDDRDIPSTEEYRLDVPNEAADPCPVEPIEDEVEPKEEERTDKDFINSSAIEVEESTALHAEGTLEADLSDSVATSRVGETAIIVADAVAPGCDEGASEANESEAVLTENAEPEGVKSELSDPEADKPEQVEAEVESSEANVETEDAETAAREVSETEATESNDVSADQPVEESTSADPQEVVCEATEPEAAQPETLETDAVETPDVDPEAVEPETLETNAVETHIVDPDAVEREQSETVEATTVDEASPTVEESSSTEPALEVPAELEAKEEDAVVESPELPTSAEPVVSDDRDIPSTEEYQLDVPNEAADPSPVEPIEDEVEPKEEERTGEDLIDSSSIAVESPTDTTAGEVDEVGVLHAEDTLEADRPDAVTASPAEESAVIVADAVAPGCDEGAADEPRTTADADKPEVAEVNDEATKASSDETSPESTPVEVVVEEQSSGQPEYDDADFADEPPAAAVDAIDEVVQDLPEVSTEAPREEPVVQEDVREASEEIAIEVEPPQSDQAAAEASPPATSEAPKTEDQYDDDEGYFDDQESAAPVAVPSLEIPAPAVAAIEAPATEDDYEEYDNEDYGEEDKPSDTPRADPEPSSTRSQPPVSAREEEIDEVADEPEQTEEEAYADEQDEYNNDYEDDEATTSRGNSPRTKKEQPPAPVEASADEYEEEEEEEYAEDEIEDSSPSPPAPKSKPAATAPPAKSDDEMDEEVGYDSEYGSDS